MSGGEWVEHSHEKSQIMIKISVVWLIKEKGVYAFHFSVKNLIKNSFINRLGPTDKLEKQIVRVNLYWW